MTNLTPIGELPDLVLGPLRGRSDSEWERGPAGKIAKLFIFGFRWFPPGRKAPERTTPGPQIDRRTAESHFLAAVEAWDQVDRALDRKSTRLNSSHSSISYAV